MNDLQQHLNKYHFNGVTLFQTQKPALQLNVKSNHSLFCAAACALTNCKLDCLYSIINLNFEKSRSHVAYRVFNNCTGNEMLTCVICLLCLCWWSRHKRLLFFYDIFKKRIGIHWCDKVCSMWLMLLRDLGFNAFENSKRECFTLLN